LDADSRVNSHALKVVEDKLSSNRLETYLNDANGEKLLSVFLYEWNNQLSSALWELISLVEVGLRNSIDEKMSERAAILNQKKHWIFDENKELGRRDSGQSHKFPYQEIQNAIKRVRKNHKEVSPQQVISETSLGFWHQMVSMKSLAVWPDIASAFPFAPSRDQRYVSELVQDLRKLRNRISHHHKLHQNSIERGELMILELAKALHPDFADWI
jgi:hypothetical protein